MEELLSSWDLESVIPIFVENEITLDNLSCITDDMIKELIPSVGTRIKFINHLKAFKKEGEEIDITNAPVVIDTGETSDLTSNGTSYSFPESTSDNVIVVVPTEQNFLPSTVQENIYIRQDTDLPDFDLKTLLTISPHGGRILNFYCQNGRLTDSLRNKLVEIIITHLYPYILKHRITHSQYNILCAKIISVFPNESSQTYYQSGHQRGNHLAIQAKGKLVYKSHNVLYQSPDKTYVRKRKKLCHHENNSHETTEAEKNAITWLRHNREPWNEVIKCWNSTFISRTSGTHNTVAELVSNWPIISDPRVDSLIEADFKNLYPGKELLLLKRWDTFFQKVLDLRRNEIKNFRDPILQNLLSSLEENSENLSEDSKVALQIACLPRLVPPKGRAKVGKDHWKFNTNETVEGIIVHANVPGDITRKIDEKIKRAQKRKIYHRVQPYLIVEGHQLSEVRNVYLVIDKIYCHSESTLKGLDTLFKCFFAFNIEFPVESAYIWYVIQKAIFDIPIPVGKLPGHMIDLLTIVLE